MTETEQIIELNKRNEERILSWLQIEEVDQLILHVERYSINELNTILQQRESVLRRTGFLVLLSENRLALSRWAGKKIDGTPLDIKPRSGRDEKIAWTKKELQEVLDSKFDTTFFYLSPNNELVTDIWSDNKLPQPNGYYEDTWYYGADRLQTVNETDAIDVLLEEGLYPKFAESFLVICREKKQDINNNESIFLNTDNYPWNTLYAHFSVRREEKYQVGTVLAKTENNQIRVYKYPLTEAAKSHMTHIKNAYKSLSIAYEGNTRICFNKIVKVEKNKIYFSYLSGQTLEDYLDSLLQIGDKEAVINKIKDYFNVIADGNLSENGSLLVTDWDCIFGNAYLKDDGYEIADYEWMLSEPIPLKYIEWRCLHYYLSYRPDREKKLGDIYAVFSITEEEKKNYQIIEASYQKKISGTGWYDQSLSLRGNIFQGNLLILEHSFYQQARREEAIHLNKEVVQIYFDRGNGFSEEKSEFVKNAYKDGVCDLKLAVAGLNAIRIDPAKCKGILRLESVTNSQEKKKKVFFYNMKKMHIAGEREQRWLADNNDPYFVIPVQEDDKEIAVKFSYQILRKPKE